MARSLLRSLLCVVCTFGYIVVSLRCAGDLCHATWRPLPRPKVPRSQGVGEDEPSAHHDERVHPLHAVAPGSSCHVPASQRSQTSHRAAPKKKKKGGSVADRAAALSAVAEAS